MPIRSQGRKKSNFPGNTGVPSGGTFDFVSGGVNYKIPIEILQAALGVTGTIRQAGDATATPVLDIQGSVNLIRNLEVDDKSGISALVSAENGVYLALDAQVPAGSGVPVLDTNNKIRNIKAGSGIAATPVGDDVVLSVSAIPGATGVVIVNVLSDFPDPIGSVIPLAADTVYFINSTVDVGVNTFSLASNTVINGINQLGNGIISSGSGTLFSNTGGFTNAITDLSITAPNATIFGLSFPTAQAALLIEDLSIVSCVSLASVNNFFRFRVESVNVTLATSDVFVFTGQCDFFNLSTVLVQEFTGNVFSLDSAVFKRFSVDTMQILSAAGANKVIEGLASSGNIVAGGFGQIQQVVVFGPFTDSSTIFPSDLQWDFLGNSFAGDSTVDGLLSMQANATNTVIAVAGTPVLVAGTWVVDHAEKMEGTVAGRLTYKAERQVALSVMASVSVEPASGGSATISAYVALNGVTIPNSKRTTVATAGGPASISLPWLFHIETNDYIEVFVANDSTTIDVLVSSAVQRVD